ncbi:hypothetical protein PGTUg99_015907 [Puccinia graminis f. sp. tritici]|uniref:Uncharacterized protein n=1 Tax=Puccinia graminis f. sp. tritici TaxID=56615 RepID=A0A5B0RRQ2_PUCGR|nr:hypothetical protein PGTUg99_015907 [Puccinia graminis f. sp. tritici]
MKTQLKLKEHHLAKDEASGARRTVARSKSRLICGIGRVVTEVMVESNSRWINKFAGRSSRVRMGSRGGEVTTSKVEIN